MSDKDVSVKPEIKTEQIEVAIPIEEDREALAKMLGVSEDLEDDKNVSTDLLASSEEENDLEEDSNEEQQEEKETDQTLSEVTTLEDRFKEYETKYEAPPADPEDPEVQLKNFEAHINKLKQQQQDSHFLQGLPDYRYNGQSVYQLTEEQFDEYLQDLKDQGKETQATNAAIARNDAVKKALAYTEQSKVIQEAEEQYGAARNRVEWFKVEKEWLAKIPELQPYVQVIDKQIATKASTDAIVASELDTYNGKMKAVYDAVRDLRLMETISKDQGKAKIEIPSAPDTKVVSKKVKTNNPGAKSDKVERIKGMSQREFDKLSDKEIALALFEDD